MEVLSEAARLLDAQGWRRSDTRKLGHNRLTIVEAIDHVTDPVTRVNRRAKNALLDHYGVTDLLILNDRFATREQAVSALLVAVVALSGPTRFRKAATRGRTVKPGFAPLTPLSVLPLHSPGRLPTGSHWACMGDDTMYDTAARFDWRCDGCVTKAETFIAAGPVPIQQWIAGPGAPRRMVPLRYLVSRSRTLGV